MFCEVMTFTFDWISPNRLVSQTERRFPGQPWRSTGAVKLVGGVFLTGSLSKVAKAAILVYLGPVISSAE